MLFYLIDNTMCWRLAAGQKKEAASETDAAKVGRKRLKSGVTGKRPMNTPLIWMVASGIAREI
jgi:hypothetical protein